MGYILVIWIVGGLVVLYWLERRQTSKYGEQPRSRMGYSKPWNNEEAAEADERIGCYFIAWVIIGGILAILGAVLD